MKTQLRKKRFTLIELLVVITIIMLIAGLVGPQLMSKLGKASWENTFVQCKNLRGVVESYYMDQHKYPSSLEDLLGKDTYGERFLSEEYIPQDAWGRDFIYQSPGGDGRKFDIISYGADGTTGGEGADRDMSCWDNPKEKKND